MSTRAPIVAIVLYAIFCGSMSFSHEVKAGSSVREWLVEYYGDKAASEAGWESYWGGFAISDWTPSGRDRELAVYMAEAYCRYVISDEVLSWPENRARGAGPIEMHPQVSGEFGIEGRLYRDYERRLCPFQYTYKTMGFRNNQYIVVLHCARPPEGKPAIGGLSTSVTFGVYVNMDTGTVGLYPKDRNYLGSNFRGNRYPMLPKDAVRTHVALWRRYQQSIGEWPIKKEDTNALNDVKIEVE